MTPPKKNPGPPEAKKHALPGAKVPPAKKLKGESFYDEPSRLLQDEKSPLFKENAPLKVCEYLQRHPNHH